MRAVCSVASETRDLLTKHLTSLHDECRGQSLDLTDMGDAVKLASQGLQDCTRKAAVDDDKWKAKYVTLSASIKAYQTRLSNLKNESRSIQVEVDTLLKLLWGTERPTAAQFSSPPSTRAPSETMTDRVAEPVSKHNDHTNSSPAATTLDFDTEPPLLSRILESPCSENEPTLASPCRPAQHVEHVEAEKVEAVMPTQSTKDGDATEIEVETLDVDAVENGKGENDSPEEGMKITDLTKELFEKGIDFSDCLDARSLRQRYKEYVSGTLSATPSATHNQSDEHVSTSTTVIPQPRMPSKPKHSYDHQMNPTSTDHHHHQHQQQHAQSNGIAADPYPNAERRMLDPMKYVWQVKLDIAQEKGVRAEDIELWSSQTRLDDAKRLYDYPSIQSYPLEVRQKGAYPRH